MGWLTLAHLSTKLMVLAVKVQIIMPVIGKMFKFGIDRSVNRGRNADVISM